jgi:hypothetical protein
MRFRTIAGTLIASIVCLAAANAVADASKSPASNSTDDAKLIASAERAAPVKIGRHATVLVMEAGKMRTLRKGTNGWTCMPDDPQVPGPNAMCMDKASMDWVQAMMEKKPPPPKVGLMYMLAGGTDASNTDPFLAKPTGQNHWIKTGPHLMIVGADQSFYDAYPKDADPDTSVPYVMWAGTPYQHLMAPAR